MGGSPGSSARCVQCRQRRRKCDLGTPCQRCLKAGTDCSGPVETVYVHLNAKVIHSRSHRTNLHAAFATRAQQGNHKHSIVQEELKTESASKALVGAPISIEKSEFPLKILSIRSLYTSLTNEFKPRSRVGIFSGDRLRVGEPMYSSIATGIRGLLPYASHSNQILDLSLFTLLTRYFGAFRKDEELVNLARSSYTMVLGEFHKHIHSMEHMLQSNTHAVYASRALLCLCLALLLFEMIDKPVSNEACEVHVNGALKILQITGPTIYHHNESLQNTFSSFRGMLIPIALRRRQKLFLADKIWQDLPFSIVGKTKAARLHDLAISIPGLIEQTDDIIASWNKSSLTIEKVIELKIEYLSLRESFMDWFDRVMMDDYGPIYWYASEQPYIKSEEDPLCIPKLRDGTYNVSFRDGPRAGLLAHYWSFRLELIMGLLDLHKIELLDDHERLLDLVPGLDVATCWREANSLSRLIPEAIPYLSSCLEGSITMQGPLETLARYHERVRSDLGSVDDEGGDTAGKG